MTALLRFFFLFSILIWSISALAQVPAFRIHTYTPAEIGFIGNTYSGDVHPNGMIYFANGDGLLEYDGVRWTNISPAGYNKVLSVFVASDGLIYIGGMNNFGYLVPDEDYRYEYVSLREKLDSSYNQLEIWQIIEFQEDIYFQGYEQILRWNGKEFSIIDFPDAYIFAEKDRVFASNFSGDFVEIKGDSILPAKDKLDLRNDAVYSIDQLNEDQYLLLTAESGIFLYTASTREISKWEREVASYLESPGLYHSIKMSDGTLVATTWQHGVVFFDTTGRVLKELELELGIEKGGLRELFQDPRGDIWLCSDFGIVKIEFYDYRDQQIPEPVFRKVFAEGVSFHPTQGETIVIRRRPELLTFQFACPGFSSHELEFSYSIGGDNMDWTEWSANPELKISNPEGGKSTILVKARTSSGKVSKVTSLNIQMPVIWYLNPFFYTLSTFFLAVIILGVVRFRSFQLRRHNLTLERQILDRTHEIEMQKKKLEKVNEELKETNKELDNFVYRSSHDLTAPLKSIRGLIELSRLEEDNKKYLDLMETSLERLENFIETVTVYSSNSKQVLQMENVKLENIVEWVLEDLRFIEGFNQIKVEIKIDSGLSLTTDKRTLYVILNNLVNNAIKYHNYDHPDQWIRINASSNREIILIEVEDNGLGIKETHKDKVFEMFYRGSERSEGSGLGLYIVKEAVQKLGGEINVQSTAGIGSRFSVQIPTPSSDEKKTTAESSQAV